MRPQCLLPFFLLRHFTLAAPCKKGIAAPDLGPTKALAESFLDRKPATTSISSRAILNRAVAQSPSSHDLERRTLKPLSTSDHAISSSAEEALSPAFSSELSPPEMGSMSLHSAAASVEQEM